MISTPKFFQEKYKYVINHPNWRCVQVDNLATNEYVYDKKPWTIYRFVL